MENKKAYRESVGFMIINNKKKVLLGKRCWPKDSPYRFQMPQGGIEEGETPEQALWREMNEEIGLFPEHVQMLGETKEWVTYELPSKMHSSIAGNKQKWFLLYFKGKEEDFILTNEKRPEFCGLRWVAPKKVPYLVIPFKKRVYQEVLKEFLPIIEGFDPTSLPQP